MVSGSLNPSPREPCSFDRPTRSVKFLRRLQHYPTRGNHGQGNHGSKIFGGGKFGAKYGGWMIVGTIPPSSFSSSSSRSPPLNWQFRASGVNTRARRRVTENGLERVHIRKWGNLQSKSSHILGKVTSSRKCRNISIAEQDDVQW